MEDEPQPQRKEVEGREVSGSQDAGSSNPQDRRLPE